jgi:hypothetical protein
MEELLPGTPHRLEGWWASGCGDDPVEWGVRTDVEMSERQRERDAEATTEESEEELNEEEVGALPRACVRACVRAGGAPDCRAYNLTGASHGRMHQAVLLQKTLG